MYIKDNKKGKLLIKNIDIKKVILNYAYGNHGLILSIADNEKIYDFFKLESDYISFTFRPGEDKFIKLLEFIEREYHDYLIENSNNDYVLLNQLLMVLYIYFYNKDVLIKFLKEKYLQSEIKNLGFDEDFNLNADAIDSLDDVGLGKIVTYFNKYDKSIKEKDFNEVEKKETVDLPIIKQQTCSRLKVNDIDDRLDASLDSVGINLTKNNYLSNPSVGRDKELKNIMVNLVKGSVILVGEAGVGKTAIVEGLTYKIQNKDVPMYLKNKDIYKISATDLISGCCYVGDAEYKVKNILNEALIRKNVILFFDEIHTAIGTGTGSKSTLDIANMIKPYIDRGDLKIIGATTNIEYDKYITYDPAFKRRFEKVIVKEPDNEALYIIIENIMEKMEKKTNILIDESMLNKDELIKSLIKLTEKYHRDQINMEYNPALVASIIEKMYSYAVYYNHSYLNFSDIVETIEDNSNISNIAKEEFYREKKNIEKVISKKKVLTKVIDFNKFKK